MSEIPVHEQRRILDAMGIDVWLSQAAEPAPPEITALHVEKQSHDSPDWAALQATVSACQHCDLHRSRTQTVFGVGDRAADWMIIGEAPGADEDRQGEPFVGRAGQLLNEMLNAVGLQRDTVFIANILKCRPPNNRDPKAEEIAACRNYLQSQIALIQPRLILAVGRIAAQNLLEDDQPVGRLRGSPHSIEVNGRAVPVVVTYHPAYLLRSPVKSARPGMTCAWPAVSPLRRAHDCRHQGHAARDSQDAPGRHTRRVGDRKSDV